MDTNIFGEHKGESNMEAGDLWTLSRRKGLVARMESCTTFKECKKELKNQYEVNMFDDVLSRRKFSELWRQLDRMNITSDQHSSVALALNPEQERKQRQLRAEVVKQRVALQLDYINQAESVKTLKRLHRILRAFRSDLRLQAGARNRSTESIANRKRLFKDFDMYPIGLVEAVSAKVMRWAVLEYLSLMQFPCKSAQCRRAVRSQIGLNRIRMYDAAMLCPESLAKYVICPSFSSSLDGGVRTCWTMLDYYRLGRTTRWLRHPDIYPLLAKNPLFFKRKLTAFNPVVRQSRREKIWVLIRKATDIKIMKSATSANFGEEPR